MSNKTNKSNNLKRMIMEKETLNQIAKFFVNLYGEEIEDITSDAIYEWWSMNWSNWVDETNQDVYIEVEKAVWAEINRL